MSLDCCEPTPESVLNAHLARIRELRPGLQLHSEDACDVCDMTARTEIGAGLRMVVLLDGAVDVSYGMRRMALAPRGGPCAALVALTEPDGFTRRARRGQYSRRLSLYLDEQWLVQAGGGAPLPADLTSFLRHHLATRCWSLAPRAAALAEQIVRPPPLVPLLQHMYLESRALELAGEALAGLCGSPASSAGPAGLRPREHGRLRELHAFLASGQADAMTLEEIARHAGVNASTLQRQFRAVFGTTVFEHLRESRLQRARQALECDGVHVGQAALLAGYTSAANFATAYRRRFGMPPKMARVRV